MLVIISGPSGVGKDTIIDALRRRDGDARLPLRRDLHDPGAAGRARSTASATTSSTSSGSPRCATPASCSRRTRSTATGTGRRARRSATRSPAAATSILKIDVQGAQVVKENVPDALLIFVVPPSLESLFQRLKSRATETADELELRQRNAAIELARQDDYDYVVVNRDGEVERDGRADRADHRPRSARATRTAGSSSERRRSSWHAV